MRLRVLVVSLLLLVVVPFHLVAVIDDKNNNEDDDDTGTKQWPTRSSSSSRNQNLGNSNSNRSMPSSSTAASEGRSSGGSIATSSPSGLSPSTSLRHPAGIQRVVEHLRDDVGINFLALDFDQTILDIHTGGCWKGSLEELFPHVRPVYAHLIRAALTNGLEVAVVTFSRQTRFVRGVMDHVFSCKGGGDTTNSNHSSNSNNNNTDLETLAAIGVLGIGDVVDTSHKIPIRGGDRSWTYNGQGSIDGKQQHMASAVEELEARRQEDCAASRRNNSSNRNNNNSRNNNSNDRPTSTTQPQTSEKPITRNTTLLLDDDPRNIRAALKNGTRAVWFNPKRPDLLLPELAKLV